MMRYLYNALIMNVGGCLLEEIPHSGRQQIVMYRYILLDMFREVGNQQR